MRATTTEADATQLVLRTVDCASPGGLERATLGSPGKVGFCFAEREEDSPWEPLHVERGFRPGQSAVTLFAGQGPAPIVDQLARTPEELIRSFAGCLDAVANPNLALGFDAIVVVPPDHARVFCEAGWTKAGRRVAMLDISKPLGDVFLDRLQELLSARGVQVERFRKPTFARPAPRAMVEEILGKSDLVVEALAD